MLIFLIGVALCFLFPIGTFIGVILIIFSGKLGSKYERLDLDQQRYDYKKNQEAIKEKHQQEEELKNDFKDGIRNNPLSEETEEIFLDLAGLNDKFFNAFKVDDDYDECLRIHLDSFEKYYEEYIGLYFYDYSIKNLKLDNDDEIEVVNLLFNKIKHYKEICAYFDRECIPELIEDWNKENKRQRKISIEKKNKLREKKELEIEQWNFIEVMLLNKEILSLEREEIQRRVSSAFFSKYEVWIALKRVRGEWRVSLNDKVKKFSPNKT